MTKSSSYPKYVGMYQPHSRFGDFNNTDPKTGEVYPSMTKQSFVAECDINNILKQFKLTGQITHINEQARTGVYADLPDPIEFQDALSIVENAERAFASLPSVQRARWDNDPEKFLQFMQDPKNAEEIYRLGLAQKPVEPGPTKVVVTNLDQVGGSRSGPGEGGKGAQPPERAR